MDRRTWVIALSIVATAIAFLAWDPGPPTLTAPPPQASDAPIATLDEATPPPIATVTLAPDRRGDVDPAAALLARFEAESVDAVWAARSTSRVHALFADLPATAGTVECRRTACRVVAELDDGADPAAGVAAVLEGLAARGVPALLQRANNGRMELVVAP
jgi:hypothetical protein